MSAFKTWVAGLTSKTTPVDADVTYLVDSADSGASKKLTWANLKATMKAYFDTLYLGLGGGTLTGAIVAPSYAANNFGGTKISGNGNYLIDLGYFSSDRICVPEISWHRSSADSPVLFLTSDAANTLAQRNSTNAQTTRLYGTYTDASNYRRLAYSMTTAGVATITPEGAGTGASGNVLHISGLPTSNPGAGILWNDSGTVKVGT